MKRSSLCKAFCFALVTAFLSGCASTTTGVSESSEEDLEKSSSPGVAGTGPFDYPIIIRHSI